MPRPTPSFAGLQAPQQRIVKSTSYHKIERKTHLLFDFDLDFDQKKLFSVSADYLLGGSAMECAAIADLLVCMQPELKGDTEHAKTKLLSVVNILSSVILK